MAISYKDAGVDVTKGYKAVELIKKHTASTFNKNVLGDLGSFGGFFSLDGHLGGEPVLVAGTDGVGTKLKYAFLADKHDTIGIDCVAMCVNDVVCQGAKPLLFLDYFAVGKLFPEVAERVVSGVAEGCRQSGCALIGGETAEMPGFYPVGEYDLAGFCVGIVDKKKIINGKNIKAGDKLIGLASSGFHSNGYSLVRKLFGEDLSVLENTLPGMDRTIKEELLTPTKIYVKTILSTIEKFDIKGIAHITGGGFIENIPRILPEGIGAKVDTKSFPCPKIIGLAAKLSELSDKELFNTFNMGIGMVLAVAPEIADDVLTFLASIGEDAYLIGETVVGEGVQI